MQVRNVQLRAADRRADDRQRRGTNGAVEWSRTQGCAQDGRASDRFPGVCSMAKRNGGSSRRMVRGWRT